MKIELIEDEPEEPVTKKRKVNPKKLSVTCPICHDARPQNEMYCAKLWFEKLLILLAALHKQRIQLAFVQKLYSEVSPFFVCKEHTIETNKELLKMLEVELPNEIPHANQEAVNVAMDSLMSFQTGNECLPILSNWHFLQIVLNFVAKHPVRAPHTVSGRYRPRHQRIAGVSSPCRSRCRICDRVQPANELKHITLQDEKLLILLVAIQKTELDVTIAQHLYSIQKMLTCRTHLEEACETLKKFLGVTDAAEILTKLGTFEAHNAVGLANCLLAEPISELLFMRQMQEICLNYCDYSKRSKLLPPRVSSIDNYNNYNYRLMIFEPNEMEVEREEVIDDTEATWNERRMEMLVSEDDEDVFIDVESLDEELVPEEVELRPLQTPPPSEPVMLQKCDICKEMTETIRDVSLLFEKMCILLVSVHRNDVTPEEAQALHGLPEMHVCSEHFGSSCRDLFAMMKLVHPMGVPADRQLMTKVIDLADFIRNIEKPLKEHVFIHLCREYWQKYGGDRDAEPAKALSEPIESCRLCGSMIKRSEVCSVSVLSEKMLVLISEVFKGTMSKGLARQYFHQLRELTLCRWHLPEVCSTLSTMFGVPRPEHFRYPKESIVMNAMFLVNVIQKGKHPFSTTDGKHLVQQCQRFTNKYWKRIQ